MSYQPITAQPSYGRPVQPMYGELPVDMICPYCQTRIMTRTDLKDGNLTYTAAGILCLLGCWLGCCFIPFCMDSCKDVIHTCPKCSAPLGKYSKLF